MKETILPYTQIKDSKIYSEYGFTVSRTRDGFIFWPHDKKRGTITSRQTRVNAKEGIVRVSAGTHMYMITVKDSFDRMYNLADLSPKEIGMIFCLADSELREKLRNTYKKTLSGGLKTEMDRKKKMVQSFVKTYSTAPV